MSAGGLSYSGLIGHRKVTLPSVNSWGTNMNILKDPPKAVYTRKIDKVGETSSITEMVDESGDRACEAIRVFARGVNPSVSVSYSNYGNNGGQSTNLGLRTSSSSLSKGESKLPYRILIGGAFRPPVRKQEDLFPLSRLPRCNTKAFTQPGFKDFSKRLRTCGTSLQTREVKNQVIKTDIRPTAVYKVQPSLEPFEIKYEIKDVISNNVNAGVRGRDNKIQFNGNGKGYVLNNPIHADAIANLRKDKYVNSSKFDTTKYIQQINPGEMITNTGSNRMGNTSIDSLVDLSEVSRTVKPEVLNHNYIGTKKGTERVFYDHKDVQMDRNLPLHHGRTNKIDRSKMRVNQHDYMQELDRNKPLADREGFNYNNIKGSRDHGSREAYLPPTLKLGGFESKGVVTGKVAEHRLPTSMNDQKRNISQSVINTMFERQSHNFPNRPQ